MKQIAGLLAVLLLAFVALYLAEHRRHADAVNTNAVLDAAADWQRDLSRAPMRLTRISDEMEVRIGDELSQEYESASRGNSAVERAMEIVEGIVLAVVAVATAWSGYQAAVWEGRQAHAYGVSTQDGRLATQSSNLAEQQRLYDTQTFNFWLTAQSDGYKQTAAMFAKRFRAEYRPAFAAWLATDPFHNPDAPAGPIVMPQYHNAEQAHALRYELLSEVEFDRGTRARENGDRYVRTTVLFATVLFLTAIAQRFRVRGVRVGILALSTALLTFSLYFVITYPVA